MKRFLHIAIWALISLVLGAVGSYLFNLSFWLTTAIAAVALTINGVIAEIEDKNDEV
jgi:hypothetical protein